MLRRHEEGPRDEPSYRHRRSVASRRATARLAARRDDEHVNTPLRGERLTLRTPTTPAALDGSAVDSMCRHAEPFGDWGNMNLGLVVEDQPALACWPGETLTEAFPGISVRSAATTPGGRPPVSPQPPATPP